MANPFFVRIRFYVRIRFHVRIRLYVRICFYFRIRFDRPVVRCRIRFFVGYGSAPYPTKKTVCRIRHAERFQGMSWNFLFFVGYGVPSKAAFVCLFVFCLFLSCIRVFRSRILFAYFVRVSYVRSSSDQGSLNHLIDAAKQKATSIKCKVRRSG